MNDIFEYYILELTAKSPVFVGSGQSIGQKDYCLLKKTDQIRFMDMEKLIGYLVDHQPEKLELFEKFMLEDPSLNKEKRFGKDGTLYTGEDCRKKKWLHLFLNLIAMPVPAREKCKLYEISNDGMFQENYTPCEIHRFMRGKQGAYIPGSSMKGILRTLLLQQLIRDNIDTLPSEENITKVSNQLIYSLHLDDIMKGISISDSEPIPDKKMTVCRKIDKTTIMGGGKERRIPVARECVRPDTKIIFHLTIDKRYFCPEIFKINFEALFYKMVRAFDKEYKEYYLPKFQKIEVNCMDFEGDFLVIGGGSGYFGKNIVYTRYGFDKGLKMVSEHMKKNRIWIPEIKKVVQVNPNDYRKHGISPHMLKLTMYQDKMYHMGICDVTLERDKIE